MKSRRGTKSERRAAGEKSPAALPRSRAEALRLGVKRYWTGKPCKHGHVGERKTSDGKCVECEREWDREYKQRPEVKARAREYKQRPEVKAKLREYWQRPEVKAKKREWNREYKQRPEVKARLREYWQRPEVKAKHRERGREYAKRPEVKARQREWHRQGRIDRPADFKPHEHKRRARKQAVAGSFTAADLQRIGEGQRWRCLCGCKLTMKTSSPDHMKPLSRPPSSNAAGNIALMCKPCNFSKNGKTLPEFIAYLREIGRAYDRDVARVMLRRYRRAWPQ